MVEKPKKREPTPEELEDEAQRSLPIAYFNFAETYWTAAKALRRSKAKATHKESPIRFLYYHAIELYLKAHLRGHGVHPLTMREKFGHKVGRLAKKSASFGLSFDDEDDEVFRLMTETDAVIRSRYIMTGFFRWPDIGALDRTCRSLRRSVGADLKKLGEPVRMTKRRKKR
jgi:hypothetical protein